VQASILEGLVAQWVDVSAAVVAALVAVLGQKTPSVKSLFCRAAFAAAVRAQKMEVAPLASLQVPQAREQ
jgi:hypothetical protein